MKNGIIIIFLISFLFPAWSTHKNTYQSSLWTYKDWRKNEVPISDIIIKSDKEIKGLKRWDRLRFGLFSKPITMDLQFKNGIVQIRIEPFYLLSHNLVIAVVLSIIFMGVWKLKNYTQHK